MMDPTHVLEVDNAEFCTIIAALRFYQENGMGEPANRSEPIHDIATDCDSEISLDADAIDSLVYRLNTGEEAK